MKLAARNDLFLVRKGEYIYFCTKDYQEELEKIGKLQYSIGDRLKQLLKQKALVVWGNLRKIEKVGEELGLENPLNESGAVLEGLAVVMETVQVSIKLSSGSLEANSQLNMKDQKTSAIRQWIETFLR